MCIRDSNWTLNGNVVGNFSRQSQYVFVDTSANLQIEIKKLDGTVIEFTDAQGDKAPYTWDNTNWVNGGAQLLNEQSKPEGFSYKPDSTLTAQVSASVLGYFSVGTPVLSGSVYTTPLAVHTTSESSP